MKKILSIIIAAMIVSSCMRTEEVSYIQQVFFAEGISGDEKISIAARVVPTQKQLDWQKLEQTVFFHFGMNTFTGAEWGDGKTSPELFNPTELDTDQWVRIVKDAGFKLVIITAKHHDGFCLWPTQTTDYSVVSSPWCGGQGDVVGELRESCEKYGVKFGIYLSPWDRNAPTYGTDAYNDFFVAQLTELLTNYGPVDEVWFDGACGEGPNGKKQVYDFPRYYAVVEKLMPQAVIAITGDDVRWVGNESGLGRETEWSVTPLGNSGRPEFVAINDELGINGMSKDLGSRELLLKAKSVRWWPSEVDVSIRPGWFYHDYEDSKVRTPENLMDIYFSSVGMNSVWLLNIPPDKRGLIHEADSVSLMKFADMKREMFSDNKIVSPLKKNWKVTEFPGSKEFAVDGDFSVIELAEDITLGQRVEKFSVEVCANGAWTKIAEGTTIGYKRLLRLPQVTQDAEKIRVTIEQSRATAYICNVAVYSFAK